MFELFDSSTANLFALFAAVAALAGVVALVLAAVFAWRDNHPQHTIRRGLTSDEFDKRETVSR